MGEPFGGSGEGMAAALTSSGSFKGDGKALRRKPSMKPSLETDELINLLHGSDPVKVELNRLENEVRDKDRELGEAQAEIKALRLSERAREKAMEELHHTFAPNCGVKATTLAPITRRLLAYQSKYVSPAGEFSNILIQNAKSQQILYDKNHTEVGAAVTGTDGGAPDFCCVLFSGGKMNNSFTFDGGVAKNVRPGCFSSNNDDCSNAIRPGGSLFLLAIVVVLLTLVYAFGL